MPDVVDIIQSVQVPQLIKDKHICKGKPMLDGRSRPLHYTGGFAVVFPFLVNGEKWAFRCWSADLGNVENRLHKLSKELDILQLPYFCNFAYEPIGIVVNGQPYPTTRMNWIEGQNIKDYLCENRNDSNKIRKLAEDFLQMCRTLHKYKIAHGDLQHGNILVDNYGQLFLIDYDSVYIPALQGESDIISGLPDYQHPKRIDNKIASEKLDYFSELIIYLSICSIAENPYLVEKYQVDDSDRLLFSKEDYIDFTQSQIYKDISALGRDFHELLDIIDGYLSNQNINDLQPFNEVLLDKKIVFTASTDKAIRGKETIRIGWNVLFESNIRLHLLKSLQTFEFQKFGQYNCILSADEVFELEVISLDGETIRKSLPVYVFDECEIEFLSNKTCVVPSLPVVLTWSVTNAKKVWLNSEEVDFSGSKIVEPTSDTVYKLQAQDEFGMKDERITVHVIPIKQMRILLASPPNFTIKQSFSVMRPQYNVGVKFPTIDIDWIRLEVPKVKSLKDLGLDVELSPPLPPSGFSLRNAIKRAYNHIIRK